MALNYVVQIEKITKACEETKPLPEDEQRVFDQITEHIGADGEEYLDREAVIRLVRGYKFESEAAGGMDRWKKVACGEADKIMAWRKEIDSPTLLGRKLEKADAFDKGWPSKLVGFDREGHPIVVERLSEFDLPCLLRNFTPDEVTIYQGQRQERAQAACKAVSNSTGKLVYKHVYVLDLKGLAAKHVSYREYLKAIFHVGQYYFPETLHKMFLLNTPFIFRGIWKVITPWIHPITRAKINLLGGDFLDDMKKSGIDPEMLPPSIGGSYTLPQAKWVPEGAAVEADASLGVAEKGKDKEKAKDEKKE